MCYTKMIYKSALLGIPEKRNFLQSKYRYDSHLGQCNWTYEYPIGVISTMLKFEFRPLN